MLLFSKDDQENEEPNHYFWSAADINRIHPAAPTTLPTTRLQFLKYRRSMWVFTSVLLIKSLKFIENLATNNGDKVPTVNNFAIFRCCN